MEIDDEKLETRIYFQYPNEDLYERKELLRDPKEFLLFLRDLLSGLAALEQKKMVHGNIKPEYIYFDEVSNKYVLLDRLSDSSPPNKAQLMNLQQGENLYMAPKVFEHISKGKDRMHHNPFKSEVFSLGMIALSMLMEEEEKLQDIYNTELCCFDFTKFSEIVEEIRKELFRKGDLEIVGDFLFYCLLNLNPQERMTPSKSLIVLEKTI